MIVLTREGVPAYVYLNPGDGDFSDVTPTPVGTGGIAPATDMGFNTDAARRRTSTATASSTSSSPTTAPPT